MLYKSFFADGTAPEETATWWLAVRQARDQGCGGTRGRWRLGAVDLPGQVGMVGVVEGPCPVPSVSPHPRRSTRYPEALLPHLEYSFTPRELENALVLREPCFARVQKPSQTSIHCIFLLEA